jgi:hypothetical protein
MNGQAALEARSACEEVFLGFHRLVDAGVASQAADLFTQEAVFELRGNRFDGHNAIRAFLIERQAQVGRRTRHLASNFSFVLDTDAGAHSEAQLLVFLAREDDPARLELEALFDTETTYVRSPGGTWQMSSRIHRLFASA